MRTSFAILLASSSLPDAFARVLRAQRALAEQKGRAAAWSDCAMEGDALPTGGLTSFGFGEDWVEASLPLGASCAVAAFGAALLTQCFGFTSAFLG